MNWSVFLVSPISQTAISVEVLTLLRNIVIVEVAFQQHSRSSGSCQLDLWLGPQDPTHSQVPNIWQSLSQYTPATLYVLNQSFKHLIPSRKCTKFIIYIYISKKKKEHCNCTSLISTITNLFILFFG